MCCFHSDSNSPRGPPTKHRRTFSKHSEHSSSHGHVDHFKLAVLATQPRELLTEEEYRQVQHYLTKSSDSRTDSSSQSTESLRNVDISKGPSSQPTSASSDTDSDSDDQPTLVQRLEVVLEKVGITPRIRGLILLNVLVLLVAANWVIVKDTGNNFDPYAFATLRFGVATLAFSPFLKKALKNKDVVRAGVELGVWCALGYLFQSAGLAATDASRASFLSTFTVIVVPLLAGLTGNGVKPLIWATSVVALVGVGLLEDSGAAFCIGDVWSFLSAVFFGVQLFRTEGLARALPSNSTLPLMSIILGTTCLLSLGATLAINPSEVLAALAHPVADWQAMASPSFPWAQIWYTGLLSTDVALLIEVIALHSVSSTDAAIVYTLEPVLGAGFAYMLLGERWGPNGFIGAALIIGSSLSAQLFGNKEGEEPHARGLQGETPLPVDLEVHSEQVKARHADLEVHDLEAHHNREKAKRG